MTCIVGLKRHGVVYLGGDSMGHNGATATTYNNEKLFRREGAGYNVVFGYANDFRYGHLLRYAVKLPPLPTRAEDLHRWAVLDFVDAIRRAAAEHGAQPVKDGVERALGDGAFLFGVGGRLFSVSQNYQVLESADGYDACGAGEAVALGALYALESERRKVNLPAEEVLTMALEAATEHTPHVRGPFTFVNTGT